MPQPVLPATFPIDITRPGNGVLTGATLTADFVATLPISCLVSRLTANTIGSN